MIRAAQMIIYFGIFNIGTGFLDLKKWNYLNLLALIAILGLAVLGLELLMGLTGLLSLGQAGFMAIGAYTSGILTVRYGFTPLPALLVAQITAILTALIIGKAVLRLKGYHMAIATLAFGVIVEQLLINLRNISGGPSGLAGVPPLSFGGIALESVISLYYLSVILVFLIILLFRNAVNCRVGRAWQAVSGDELAAGILGVDVKKYKLLAFVISACLATLSGSLYVHYMRFVSPDMVGMSTSFNLLVMTILGGLGTLYGPLLGTALLVLLPDLISSMVNFQLIINGCVLLLTVVFFPRGLYGLLSLVGRQFTRILSPKGSFRDRGDADHE